MTHKRLWIIGLAAVITLLLSLPTTRAQDTDIPTFRIGVLAEERSPLADGARLAVRQINDAGGVVGADESTFQLELLIVPPEDDLLEAIAVLDEEEVVAVIGPASSDDILDNLPTLALLDAPILTPASDDTLLIEDRSELVFRVSAAHVTLSQALVDYLVNEFQLTDIAVAQLDVASTAEAISFVSALSAAGVEPATSIVLESSDLLEVAAAELVEANPAVIAAFGTAELAAALYNEVRDSGWDGIFVYNGAFDPAFNALVEDAVGILAALPWTYTMLTERTAAFVNGYIRTYGEIPEPNAAAGFDAVTLIAAGLALPGELQDNLLNLSNVEGVQGVLKPQAVPSYDTSPNAVITRVGEFGAPDVLARFVDGVLLPAADVTILVPDTPVITATPEGVFVTITSPLQNVRSGPGSEYEVLGTLSENEQAPVIGRSADNQWVVVDFGGQQGWLAAYLLEVTGDLLTVPVITIPPTPTLSVTLTPTAEPIPDVIIDSASVVPQPIVPNQNFTITVQLRNIGAGTAPPFSIAANLAPNNLFLTAPVPSLAPGQTTTVTLNGLVSTTGTFTTSLIVDSNNTVDEGVVGEQNNLYNLTYRVDRPTLRQGSQTLNLGDTVDFEQTGTQGDANWNNDGGVLGLKALFGARLGLLAGQDFNAVTYDQLSPTTLTRDVLNRSELGVGTLFGVITADGNRAVAQVNSISDTQLTITWRVYSN